jgi:large subunit ribosomal protein L21
MYAVIATGGKQYRVEEGQRIEVERLGEVDSDVDLRPVLVVDGDTTLATPTELAGAVVSGRIVGAARGPKINAFTYKNKSNVRKRWGHRQHYAVVEITKIAKG